MQDMQREQRRRSLEKMPAEIQDMAESTSTSPSYRNPLDDNGSAQFDAPVETAKDLAIEVIHAVDDPDLNPVCKGFRCRNECHL